jgi:hypothetical protein
MLSKQTTKRNYLIELIFIVLCADWSAWEFQEVLNNFPFSNFFKQVDGKNWQLHLQMLGQGMFWGLKITERSHASRFNK